MSALPFLVEIPYCVTAIYSSPVERWNPCFLLVAIGLGLAVIPLIRNSGNALRFSSLRLCALIPALALLAFGFFKHIHLAVLLGGILLPCAMVFCLYGWITVFRLLPAFGALVLFCPNIGLLLAMAFPLDALALKVIAAIGLAACVLLMFIFRKTVPRPASVGFAMVAVALLLAFLARGQAPSFMPPAMPKFERAISQNFKGIQETELSRERLYFGNSNVHRYYFANSQGNIINVLDIKDIDNIHQVHPSVFCLRIGGGKILSEQVVQFPENDASPTFEALEDVAEFNGQKRLYWQWYSTPVHSTSSFLLFRSLYTPKDNWAVYIIDTDVTDSLEESRRLLYQLVQDFM